MDENRFSVLNIFHIRFQLNPTTNSIYFLYSALRSHPFKALHDKKDKGFLHKNLRRLWRGKNKILLKYLFSNENATILQKINFP